MELRKTVVSILMLGLLMLAPAQAFAHGASYIEHDCGQEKCVCFIQLGDQGNFVKGIIKLLKEQGYLSKKIKVGFFTDDVEAAVKSFQEAKGLPATGTMDDDTLTFLIWGMSPEQLDILHPFTINDPKTNPHTVYVPTNGGKKRHRTTECSSNMYNPRKVSVRNAEALGYGKCGICGIE